MKKEHWVEFRYGKKWNRGIVSRIKPDGKYIVYTGFGCMCFKPKDIRELR